MKGSRMKLKPIYFTPIFIVAAVILISGCMQKEGTSVKYDESSPARNVSVISEESEESNDRVTILKNVHIPDKMALWTEEVDAFNFRHGPDKRNHRDVTSSDLISIIRKYWERNTLRPSSFLKTED